MNIVTRSQWGAAKEANRPRMTLPATALWLHHSVTAVTDDPYADMRTVQRIGIQRFGYFSYSYAIHPASGVIMEGQGLRVGAHTRGQNSTTFGVVLIGNYMTRVVTDAQVDAVRWLIWHLRHENYLRPGTYPSGGHRDVPGAKTACPGDWAMKRLPDMRLRWLPDMRLRGDEPLPEPVVEVAPMYNPPFELSGKVVASLPAPGGGVWVLTDVGAVYAFHCRDIDAPNRHPDYWGDRVAARLEPLGEGFVVVDSGGNRYEYP